MVWYRPLIGLTLLFIQFHRRACRAAWDVENTSFFIHASDIFHRLVLSLYRPTSFQDFLPASFGELFRILDVVGDQRFGVFSRKLANIYLVASKKHLESSFNL